MSEAAVTTRDISLPGFVNFKRNEAGGVRVLLRPVGKQYPVQLDLSAEEFAALRQALAEL